MDDDLLKLLFQFRVRFVNKEPSKLMLWASWPHIHDRLSTAKYKNPLSAFFLSMVSPNRFEMYLIGLSGGTRTFAVCVHQRIPLQFHKHYFFFTHSVVHLRNCRWFFSTVSLLLIFNTNKMSKNINSGVLFEYWFSIVHVGPFVLKLCVCA